MNQLVKDKYKETFSLFLINLKTQYKNVVDYIFTAFSFYSDPSYAKVDAYLVGSYLFDNPFRISKRYFESMNEPNPYLYGETPLRSIELIANECRLSSEDRFYELGCGRGRVCFWIHHFIGCPVVGVDCVPDFIQRAQQVQEKFKLENINFLEEDFLKTDVSNATVVYVYGTCYTPPFIQKLIQRFKSLPKGAKVITVSYALQEFDANAPFEVLKCFRVNYTWGTADVYLQVKTQ